MLEPTNEMEVHFRPILPSPTHRSRFEIFHRSAIIDYERYFDLGDMGLFPWV